MPDDNRPTAARLTPKHRADLLWAIGELRTGELDDLSRADALKTLATIVERLLAEVDRLPAELHAADEATRKAEQLAKAYQRTLEERTTERDEARDCRQDGVCRLPPGCQRHWEERNRELVRELEETRRRDFFALQTVADSYAGWQISGGRFRELADWWLAGKDVVAELPSWKESADPEEGELLGRAVVKIENLQRERDDARAALEALRPKEGEVLVRAGYWTAMDDLVMLEFTGANCHRVVMPASAIVEFPPVATKGDIDVR